MNRNLYFLLCTFFVLGSYQASAIDTAPAFRGGHNISLAVCQSSGANSISTLLSITDPDPSQTETWSVLTGVAHGTLVASVATTSGAGGIVTASGMTYAPAAGFTGTDSFVIRVSDGTLSDTTTVHVIINPLPEAITGPGRVCLGATILLADTGTGTWSTTGSIATVDPSSGTVTGVGTGYAIITYTAAATGCKTTKPITVNPVPGAVTGAYSVCSGLIAELFGTGGGTWSSSNTAVATVNPGTGYYTGVSAGSTAISYTLAGGCASIAIVTVNQTPPAIGGAVSVCQGTTTSLSNGLPGGAWASSNTAIATINASGNLVGVSAGSVYISYTVGSCSTVEIIPVYAVDPVVGAAALCVGGRLTLTNGISGGIWSSAIPGVATVSATGIVTATAAGSSVISYETPTGCFSSATVTVNASPLPITGSMHICSGATTTLANGDAGGTWTSSNTVLATVDEFSGTVTGVAAGTPLITYTVAGGCTVTTIVTVSPLPVAIAGPMSACTGQTAGLLDFGSGTWSSTNTTVATINASSGYYTGLAAGTVAIIYTLPGGCTASALITINATPAITGAPAVCLGAGISLSASLPGGIWSSSNTGIAIIAGGAVTTVSAGTVTITYTLGSCLATKPLVINPEAPVTGVTTVCTGGSTLVFNSIAGGTWSSASPGVATVSTTGVVTGVAPGSVVVTYALPTGCFTSANITVNLVPLPITGALQVCRGATTALSDPDGGGTWTSSNPTVVSINNTTGVATGLLTGAPIITYSFSTGCRTTAIVTVNPLPNAISGPLSVCAGFETPLTDIYGGAWSSSNTIIATIDPLSGYALGILPGTASITYAFPSGCSASAVLTVNTNPAPITGSSTICQGDSIILNDAVGSGVWTAASSLVRVTSASGIGTITGLTPGLATILYSIGSCTASKVVDVLRVTPIIGVSSVCNGTSATLADISPGGTWSSSNTSVATVTPVTGVLTSLSPGAIFITYTLPGACTAVAPFTVNVLPVAITSASNLCLDSSLTLTDATPGGLWTVSPASVATIDISTGVLTALGTGVPVVTYTLGTGCATTTRLTVHPLPDGITAPDALCAGLSAHLVDIGGGSWSSSDNTRANINTVTGVTTGVSAGLVVITYTLNGCIAVKNIVIDPVPPAIIGDSAICSGTYHTLSDSGGGTWSTNNETVAIIDMSTGVVSGHAAGTATLTYTLPVTGCYITRKETVTICALAVEQVTNRVSSINVLPNPNNGTFTISGTLGTSDDAAVKITLCNMLGQPVYTNNITALSGSINEHVLAGNSLPAGMYLLNLQWGNERKAFHVVIQE